MAPPGPDPGVAQLARQGNHGRSTSLLAMLLESIQDHVAHAGVFGLVEGVLGVLAFGGLLSSLLGDSAIKAGAIVAVILGILGLFILLAANRAERRQQSQLDRRLLRKYLAVLEDRFDYAWSTTNWHQTVNIKRNGDTFETITLTLVADCDLLDYFSIWLGPGWEWPSRLQRKVKVSVQTVRIGNEGGTRPDISCAWFHHNRIAITVHLGEPVSRGQEVSFSLTLVWPLKCAPLFRGQADEFTLTFSKLPSSTVSLPSLYYAVVLPVNCNVCYDAVGLKRGNDDYTLTGEVNNQGQVEVILTADNVPPNRRVGMRLDLTRK